jgi:hypothetical protein
MPGESGGPVVTTLVCLPYHLHARLRVHWAPGIPHALYSKERRNSFCKTRAHRAARSRSHIWDWLFEIRIGTVIPGQPAGLNTESITTIGSMDSGLARSLSSGRALRGPVGAPRNDEWWDTARSASLRGATCPPQLSERRRTRRSNPLSLAVDCFVEPVIGRAFARPVGSQSNDDKTTCVLAV